MYPACGFPTLKLRPVTANYNQCCEHIHTQKKYAVTLHHWQHVSTFLHTYTFHTNYAELVLFMHLEIHNRQN